MTRPQPLIVIGGGEHARVVIDAARSRPDQWDVLGFIDPEPCMDTVRQTGVPRLGDEEEGMRMGREPAGPALVLGVGGTGVATRRQSIIDRYAIADARWAAVIHEAAHVARGVAVGPGAVIMVGAIVNSGAVIGPHVVVNTAAVVEHDVHIGAFCQLAPRVAVGGGTWIGAGTYVGLGSTVRDHIRVGRDVVIGMGAVVVGDVHDGRTVMGLPARPFERKR